MTRSERERIGDMIDQVELLRRHLTERADLDDEVKQAASLRWLEVLGEAAATIPEPVRAAHPEVPWRQLVGMRNILIHAYPDVLLDRVWAARHQLDDLAEKLEAIRKEMAE